ncbi:hypothetical protein COEREDRAFT_81874 [Coemansia reversa NRRL 1564]|uniref:Uncharacterized protein n=1 Tax=Coemansia reversa (strain ATCC 12441 / NRRL 1564) TaxID=763665 RepID=A0A2G5B975_COERN|nr:hypothetical protein COEREDRAFT_81874 [Coemansia reversa NRRL 1564]|eukprot:PIA15540.1 hypothetical protein COEREDRAFT_81874 [Coemansia reversa NRRL 1564]
MDMMGFSPVYNAVFALQKYSRGQQELEYASKEADRKHREYVRELKYKRHTELSLWVPSRFRKNHRNAVAVELADRPTTIKWAE